MSTKTKSTPEQEQVTRAQAALDIATQVLTEHRSDLAAATTTLDALRADPLNTSAEALGTARSRLELLDLATPIREREVAEARAELRFALGEHYSNTLPDQIDAPSLRAQIAEERDKLAEGLRRIGALIEGWNTLLRSTVDQCRAVDLVEGLCDPFAPIAASKDGHLVIHGQTHTVFDVQGTQQVRTEQALAAVGFVKPEVKING